MNDLDKILRELMDSEYSGNNTGTAGECLSEEVFAGYMENLLSPRDRERVVKHLDECESCFQKSIMLSRVAGALEGGGPSDVPREVTEKAKRLVREQSPKDMVEVALEFGKGIITVIRDAAGICTLPGPAVLSARSGGKPGQAPLVAKVSRRFGVIRADITLEKTGVAGCEIEARITDDTSGSPIDDIRINLMSGEKELASYLTMKGTASFKNLAFDTYILIIYRGKEFIGSVRLSLSSVQ